jgi:predicted transglutaminase-like cysteine proteinase
VLLNPGLMLVLAAMLTAAGCAPRFTSANTTGQYVYFPVDPRQLITPQDASIKQALNTITSNQTDFRSDFRKLQDWVASHIVYSQDSYYRWQMPVETLTKRTGNCKDFAVLLCTLSRAAGVPSGDIYVAIGKDRSNKSHAFIIEKWLLGRWQVIEPQTGGFIMSDLSGMDTADRYAITSRFNDTAYYGQPAFITGSETFLSSGAPASPAAGRVSEDAASAWLSSSPPAVVNPLPEIDYFYFKSSPNIVGTPGSTMLTWQAGGASSVYIDRGVGYVAPSGSRIVTAAAGTTYILTAKNANGEVRSMVVK